MTWSWVVLSKISRSFSENIDSRSIIWPSPLKLLNDTTFSFDPKSLRLIQRISVPNTKTSVAPYCKTSIFSYICSVFSYPTIVWFSFCLLIKIVNITVHWDDFKWNCKPFHFKQTSKGRKTMFQELQIYFAWNPRLKGIESASEVALPIWPDLTWSRPTWLHCLADSMLFNLGFYAKYILSLCDACSLMLAYCAWAGLLPDSCHLKFLKFYRNGLMWTLIWKDLPR